MANKIYGVYFTSGDPRTQTALTPTLVIFSRMDTGAALTAPGITQAIAGSGIFQFEYQPTLPIAFLADGGAGSGTGRFVVGQLDPIQLVDFQAVTLTALGTTNIALGTTNVALGTTNIALGTSSIALGATNVAIGTSISAQGTSLSAISVTILAAINSFGTGLSGLAFIGSTASSLGSTNTDPADLMGYVKRLQEWLEGNEIFTKTSGIWQKSTRGNTMIFAPKTLGNTITQVTKS